MPATDPGVDTTPPGGPPAGAPDPMPIPETAPAAASLEDPAADPAVASVQAGPAEPDKVEMILAVVAFLVTVGAVVVLALMKVE